MKEDKFNKYIDLIKNRMSLDRFNHSFSVAITSANLAMKYDQDIEKCLIAGLLHDIAKEMTIEEYKLLDKKYNIGLTQEDYDSPKVLHGIVGSYIVQNELNINDNEILLAIKHHTLGNENMSDVEKIIFIADYIEPLREEIKNINEIRKLAYTNLDVCVYKITSNVLEYLKTENTVIHSQTLKTFDYYKKGN